MLVSSHLLEMMFENFQTEVGEDDKVDEGHGKRCCFELAYTDEPFHAVYIEYCSLALASRLQQSGDWVLVLAGGSQLQQSFYMGCWCEHL